MPVGNEEVVQYGVIAVEEGNPLPLALIEQLEKLPKLPELPKEKLVVAPTVKRLVIIPLRP